MNEQDNIGYAALHWATEHDHSRIVEVLLLAGTNKYLKDKSLRRQTALDRALSHRRAAMVRLLCGEDYEGNELLRSFKYYAGKDSCLEFPIWYAVLFDHELIPVFAKSGANMEAVSAGDTPLTFAVSRGDASLVERLLRAGSSPLGKNHMGQTAQELATERGHHGIASSIAGFLEAPGQNFAVNVEVSQGEQEGELFLTFTGSVSGQTYASFPWAAEQEVSTLPSSFLKCARRSAAPDSSLHSLLEFRLKFLHKNKVLQFGPGAAPLAAQVAC